MVPVVCGANETDNVHVWPVAITADAEQVPVLKNSPRFAVVNETFEMCRGAEPVFVKVTVCASDVVPMLRAGKDRIVGERLTADAIPEPVSGTEVVVREP